MAVAAANAVQRTYLMVDITPNDDCKGVAPMLQKRGWKNLIRKLLPVQNAKDDAFRDDAHPDLPIKDGTVLPAGRIAKAKTKTDGWVDEECFLPYQQTVRNMEFLRGYLWKPGVIGDLAAKKGQLLDSSNTVVSGKSAAYPDLLFLSSHGYPDGRFQQHYKRKSEPEHDHDYHIVFECPELDAGVGWQGENLRYVIFSACNALRPELAYRWAQAMRKSGGPRGILGFYSISPGPAGTITYMQNFFAREGKPMIEAWVAANASNPWSALIFEDAKTDTFAAWSKGDLKPEVSNSSGKIIFYHKTEAPKGIDVEQLHPKKMLSCAIVWIDPGGSAKWVSESAGMKVGETFWLLSKSPTSGWAAGTDRVEISLVNLRENWWEGGKNAPDLVKLGVTGIRNSAGTTVALKDCTLKTKFGKSPAKDTIVIPKNMLGKWVAAIAAVKPEAYKWFYGESAKLWIRVEAIDSAGKSIGRGTTIPQGLLPLMPASDRRAPTG